MGILVKWDIKCTIIMTMTEWVKHIDILKNKGFLLRKCQNTKWVQFESYTQ